MPRTLVIRFGSLGDLCVCGWFASGLAGRDPRRIVEIATKERFAELAGAFRGVAAVHPLRGGGPGDLADLASRLRREDFDRVLDAHAVTRSRLLTLLMGRPGSPRLAKDTAARLALLARQRLHQRDVASQPPAPPAGRLARGLLDRFDALADGAPGRSLLAGDAPPPLAHLRPDGGSDALGLAPGARWPAKRWPADRWAALLRGLGGGQPRPIRIFLGPDEREWYDAGPLAAAARDLPDVETVRESSLVALARRLASCRLLVANDSGLLHLAEATGTPVLALFGPTTRHWGYFPLLPGSGVIERDLACRPCSRNGKRPCHRDDRACLAGIEPARVADAVAAALADAPGGSP